MLFLNARRLKQNTKIQAKKSPLISLQDRRALRLYHMNLVIIGLIHLNRRFLNHIKIFLVLYSHPLQATYRDAIMSK